MEWIAKNKRHKAEKATAQQQHTTKPTIRVLKAAGLDYLLN
jgi:hypothetical protein